MNKIKELINYYKPRLKIAGSTPPYSDVAKLNKDFIAEVKNLDGVEEEIEGYLKWGLITNDWTDEHLWIRAAIAHPSEKYLNYYIDMINLRDNKVPYWRVLDALAYMPESLNFRIVKEIENAIIRNNTYWNEEDFKKAFEVLTWIADESDIKFINQLCNCEVERIAKMADYWKHWIEEDED